VLGIRLEEAKRYKLLTLQNFQSALQRLDGSVLLFTMEDFSFRSVFQRDRSNLIGLAHFYPLALMHCSLTDSTSLPHQPDLHWGTFKS
jgi:hypothetical protein